MLCLLAKVNQYWKHTHTHTQSKTKRIVSFHFEIFCSDFNFDLGFLLRENCCSLACKFIMHKMPTEILIKYILKVLLFAHTHAHMSVKQVCVCVQTMFAFSYGKHFMGCCCCFKHFMENSIFLCSLPKFGVLFQTFSRFFSRIKPPTLCTQCLSLSVCVWERVCIFCCFFSQVFGFVLHIFSAVCAVCMRGWVGALLCFYLF